MEPETVVRFGVVGSGGIASTHAEALSRIPLARLGGVYSRNPANAEALATRWNAKAFTSLESLLDSGEIDAVLVATPSGAHEEVVLPALRAGLHVLCEKPLEISMERVERMTAEAKGRNLILAGFFPLRYGTGAQAIRKALEAGRFGRLTFLSARVKWWRDQDYYNGSSWRGTWRLDGGGALMNQGIHAVDLLQWLGGPVSQVSGIADQLAHKELEVEDTLTACLQFQSGALGTIAASTSCYPGLDLTIEISGDRGTAILRNDKIEFWQFAEEQADDNDIRTGGGSGKISGGNSDPRAITCEGHRQQIDEFGRAILGQKTNIIDGHEAGKSVAIVEAIYRSCRTKKLEPIHAV